MKQFGFSILAMFFAGLAFTACSSDDDVMATSVTPDGGAIKITAGIENGNTRTAMNGTETNWSVGDAIGITMTTGTVTKDGAQTAVTAGDLDITKYNKKYVFAGVADAATGIFDYTMPSGSVANEALPLKKFANNTTFNFYAYYPYADGNAEPNTSMPADIVFNTLAGNQNDVALQKMIDFMYCNNEATVAGGANSAALQIGGVGGEDFMGNSNVSLLFRHMMTKLTFNVNTNGAGFAQLGTIDKVTVNLGPIMVNGTFHPLTGKVTATDEAESIGAVDLTKSGSVWSKSLILIPQDLSGASFTLTISAYNTTGETPETPVAVFSKANVSLMNMAVETSNTMTLTPEAGGGITITGVDIAPWGAGADNSATIGQES